VRILAKDECFIEQKPGGIGMEAMISDHTKNLIVEIVGWPN
jgi:hypothetical protein